MSCPSPVSPALELSTARSPRAASRVLVVGRSPWGVSAAAALERAGVGHVHSVACEARAPLGPEELVPEVGRWDLIVAALPGDELMLLHTVARAAHALGCASLYACMDHGHAVLGPAVVPPDSACWNCCRARLLASSEPSRSERELHASLFESRVPIRRGIYNEALAAALGELLALEALKLVDGLPSSVLERLRIQAPGSLMATFHPILRLPWCDVCGGAAAAPPRVGLMPPLDSTRDAAALRDLFARWVDDRTGIIRSLDVASPDALDPELPVQCSAPLADNLDGGHATEPDIGSGKGLTLHGAMLGAVGEAIERYAATRYRKSDLRRASWSELSDDRLDPRDMCPFSDAQYAEPGFPYQRFEPDRPIDWLRGRWLDSDTPVWVPAVCTYLDYAAPPEEYFAQVTSSGLAAGRDLADATFRALSELVERDAWMVTWLARRPGRRLAIDDTIEAGAREVARQLGQCGATVELYLLDAAFGVATVACLGLGDGVRWPGLTLGLGAHPDVRVAASKALLEQGQVGPCVRRAMRANDQPVPATDDDVHGTFDHALYYVPAARRRHIDFLRDDSAISPGDLASEFTSLTACVARLGEAGVRVAAIDVTPPDLRGGPLCVVRALATHLQPIDFGFRFRRLAAQRLATFVAASDINPHPHPLA